MKGTTGLAGLVVTALVAALVAFAVAALLGPSPRTPPPAGPGAGGDPDRVALLEREVASLKGRLEEIRAARGPTGRRPAGPAGGGAAGGEAPGEGSGLPEGAGPYGETGEDAPPPATRGELLALIDERIAETGAGGPGGKPPPPKPRMTIQEAGAEMGLTAFEIDAAHRAFQTAETELITCVMGTADMEAIKEEVRGARDDPDRKAALVQKAVGNMIRNLGRVMTIEDRRDRELKKFLTGDQVKELRGYNLKPTMADDELQDILKDVFDR